MTAERPAHVSIVIPVYNGEQFIADCIRSVQAQTHPHWDLTIGNNRSTDRTVAIAEEFAAADSRIRIVTYPEFVSVVDSHNNAFTLISDKATYCMVLGADDLMFPRCLEEKVQIGEAYPTVGLIGSYVLEGDSVIIPTYKFPDNFIPGREVGRFRFLQNTSLFGGPSTSLIRASIVRRKRPFYNPVNYYGDLEAYLDLLQEYDFGFVHQVLTYTRKGTASRTTSYLGRVHAPAAMRMHEVTRFGAHYLSEDERVACLRKVTHAYYRFLGESVWELHAREFWDYHLKHVRKMGYPARYGLIGWYALLRVLDLVGNPLRTVSGAVRRVANTRARKAIPLAESHGPTPTASSASSPPTVASSGPQSSGPARTTAQ
jgi:glycosyltransferase involved in cell wall biosynthesis